MVKTAERRRFERIPFEHAATLKLGSEQWPTEVQDLSLKGALVVRPIGWPGQIGQSCKLDIPLGKDEKAIQMKCIIVGMREDRLHLLVTYQDLDSVSRLKRLVELNLGEAELLERDLGNLIDSAD
ncbi:PilZ domain-containing protein [Gallaecimonas sp. GXIMD4217]|uniref:PilZ domain-containing protein n=1 Tax=Gallaecimonas sp. GXIMD4217 TaxID=3131927 RepID=UPI00311AC0B9